jgi:Glycosyl hydrolases family 18
MRAPHSASVFMAKASLLLACVALAACQGNAAGPPAVAPTGAAGQTNGTGTAGTGAGDVSATGEAGASVGTGAAGSTATGAAGAGAAGASGVGPDGGAGAGPSGAAGGGTAGNGPTTGQGGASGGGAGGSGGGGVSGAAGATGAAGGAASTFPARLAAPYVETWSNISLTDLATATGNKFYTLAFMLGSGCTPKWNGDTSLDAETYYAGQITNLRKVGGDVIISFGGADGTELGDVCTTVDSLQAAYQAVITKYGLKWMDFDIESGAESKTADIDRRNKAIKNLQAANPGLKISYTLGVDPSGLPGDQRAVLANAQTNGVHVDTVNVMAMDYGACNLDMGMAAISAAEGTRTQIQKIGSGSNVGVTPMIGVNDTSCEDFTTANATALVTYAQANDYINLLAFWAVGADTGHAYLNIFKSIH